MTLGEKLKDLREARGWSQSELARQARVRQALLSELESGRKADSTGSVLRRLAEALKVSVDYLLWKSNDPRPCPGGEPCMDSRTLPPVTLFPERKRADEEYSRTSP